jgi:hypothetical protein
MRTSRSQLVSAVLTLAHGGELEVLPKLVKREQLEVAQELGALVQNFDYLESLAFAEAVRGKSPQVVAALQRKFSEPVKRTELQEEFYEQVRHMLDGGQVERYLPESASAKVDSIRRKLEALNAI